MNNRNELWFKTSKVGWGWTPANKWGWATVLTYCISITGYPLACELFNFYYSLQFHVTFSIFLTITLGVLATVKGEKPSWQKIDRDRRE